MARKGQAEQRWSDFVGYDHCFADIMKGCEHFYHVSRSAVVPKIGSLAGPIEYSIDVSYHWHSSLSMQVVHKTSVYSQSHVKTNVKLRVKTFMRANVVGL